MKECEMGIGGQASNSVFPLACLDASLIQSVVMYLDISSEPSH